MSIVATARAYGAGCSAANGSAASRQSGADAINSRQQCPPPAASIVASRNTRAPLFRPPWAPEPGSHRALWRAQQRRYEAPPEARGYDKDWRELRDAHLAEEPICRER